MPFHHHLRVHPLWAPLAQSIAHWSPEPEDNNEDSDDNDDTQESYDTDEEPTII